MKLKKITIKLPADIIESLEIFSEKENKTVEELIIIAIEEFIEYNLNKK